MKPNLPPLRIALIYAAFGSLWIIVSDTLVDLAIAEASTRVFTQTLKGLLYIAVTAVLVYTLASRDWKRVSADMAELRGREAGIRRSEAAQRALIEASPQAIVSLGPDGRVLTWNRSAERIFGWNADEVRGRPLPIVPEHAREKHDQLFGGVMEGRGFSGTELQQARKDGASVPVRVSAAPIPGEDGGRVGVLATYEDIRDRKERELEHDRLLRAIEQSREAVLITDAAARIQYVNPAFEEITGYSREEAKGRNPRILNSGEHEPEFYRSMWQTLLAGETWHGRMVNRRKDGQLYTEETTISPVRDESGAIVNYVAVKRDVTRELTLEHQLRQAQKMDSIGRLAGGLAHDFNNVLTVIQGHTELALSTMDATDPLHPDLEEIRAAAEHSADLIRQLLSFARQQTVAPKVLDLNKAVASRLDFLGRLIGEDIELRWRPDEEVWPVRIDPTQVDQILTNLLVNARDAIRGVGSITIETAKVDLDEEYAADHVGSRPGGFTMLAVTDTGSGMDRTTAARAFEPFFTTKLHGEGTGLGLATVYGIVKQNQGFIYLYSEPGSGSTFRIYLPRVSARELEAEERSDPQEVPTGTEVVLLVEDEKPLRGIASRFLERLGYAVLPAEGPRDALELVRGHSGPLDLVLTDVVMPEMNGRELYEQLAALRPEVRCVFMSGYTADVIAHRGVLHEDVHFLQKPFSLKQLATALRKALSA